MLVSPSLALRPAEKIPGPVAPHGGTQTPPPQHPVSAAWQKEPGPKTASQSLLELQLREALQEKFSPQAMTPSTVVRHAHEPPGAGVWQLTFLTPQMNVSVHWPQSP
jgi:hypothetical protein